MRFFALIWLLWVGMLSIASAQTFLIGDKLTVTEKRQVLGAIAAVYKDRKIPSKLRVQVWKRALLDDGQEQMVLLATSLQAPAHDWLGIISQPILGRAAEIEMLARSSNAQISEVLFVPNRLFAGRDIFVRFQRGCNLFSWNGPRDGRYTENRGNFEWAMFQVRDISCETELSDIVRRMGICRSQNGDWFYSQGSANLWRCTFRTADGGKSCEDPSDCETDCLYLGPVKPIGTQVKGTCSPSWPLRPCGPQKVEKGRVIGVRCIPD